jgi:hypothetical protein
VISLPRPDVDAGSDYCVLSRKIRMISKMPEIAEATDLRVLARDTRISIA